MTQVTIQLQDSLVESIQHTLKFGDLTEDEIQTLTCALNDKYINISGLKIVKRTIAMKGKGLIDVVRGTKLRFPALENSMTQSEHILSEYAERKKYLLRKAEEREYNQMVHGTALELDKYGPSEDIGKQFSALQHQVSILLNVVVATLSAFGIGYYFGSNYFSLGFNQSMVVGVCTATVVMLIEMTLFILRASQMDG